MGLSLCTKPLEARQGVSIAPCLRCHVRVVAPRGVDSLNLGCTQPQGGAAPRLEALRLARHPEEKSQETDSAWDGVGANACGGGR